MKINPGFFWSKFLWWIHRPALRDCRIHKTSKVSSGTNCIGVSMGRYSYMGKNNSACNAEIGSFCSIASHCSIGGGVHRLDSVSTSPVFEEGRNILGKNFTNIPKDSAKKVIIGSDVWIGESVFVKAGVRIGNGVVIGAHSVVTHDVPDYCVVAGVPAKVIRKRFDDETVAALLESQWWQWSDEKLQQYAPLFDDPGKLLAALNEND